MKMFITNVLTAITLTAASTTAFADSGSVTCKDFTDFFDAGELSQVIEQTALNNAADIIEYETIGGYKFFMANPNILKELSSGKPLKELLPGEYRWMIPSDDGCLTIVALNDGAWEAVGRIISEPELIASGAVDDSTVRFDKINAAIENIALNDPSGITDIVCFYIYEYAGDFVCITTENNNYLVPFSARPDFTKLTNGEIYDLSEAYGTLVQNFGEYKVPTHAGKKAESYTLEEIKDILRVYGADSVPTAVGDAGTKSVKSASVPFLPILIIPAVAIIIAITVILHIWNKGSRKHTK